MLQLTSLLVVAAVKGPRKIGPRGEDVESNQRAQARALMTRLTVPHVSWAHY